MATTESPVLSLEEIRERFRDRWVLVRVTETDEVGTPRRGVVLTHGTDRDEIARAQRDIDGDLAIFHTGDVPQPGHAIAF